MIWLDSRDPREMLRHAAAHLPRVVLCRVLADVAETALPYCDDDSVTAAVWAWDATRRWCRGETSLDEVEAARAARAAALGRGRDASAEQWEEWDELHRRVAVLDQAEAEEEARNG